MIDQANELRRLVQQHGSSPADAADAGPSIIAVTGGKGGVGTTTVAIRLAAALARGSDRVLLVDADPDRSDVAALCGLAAGHDPVEPAAARSPLDEALVRGPDGILVLPGATRPAMREPAIDCFHARWMDVLRNARTPFDLVVVDTGNGTSRSVRKLWEAAELVLLVTTPELPSVLDAYASIKTLARRDAPPPIHTLVNRVDEPAVAYDVHGRLARAVWRFLGFHLDSAGYLSACPGLTTGESESRFVRQFDQLARGLRAAACPPTRRRPINRPVEEDYSEGDECPRMGSENLVSQVAQSGET
jgi:flagellar biosynthesis protein FlhG